MGRSAAYQCYIAHQIISTRLYTQPVVHVTNNYHGMTINGNFMLASGREETAKSHTTQDTPSSRAAQVRGKAPERYEPAEEYESYEESSTESNTSRTSSIVPKARSGASRSTAGPRDHTYLDEGYDSITTSSTQSKHSERVSSGFSEILNIAAHKRSKRISPKTDIEEHSLSGDETHLAKQENDDYLDDSDDVRYKELRS
ncbi:hypothetical protein BJ878DRAFT_476563 [Calycina marina]|uniref:Uncharacterized protein n=1 Tax=Calycina marina TaxID=1763456 RepID=A0A9P7ZAS2_9HELO|nr:hypothetical protein BJ878DRAFT_476563 [Calycina marina]